MTMFTRFIGATALMLATSVDALELNAREPKNARELTKGEECCQSWQWMGYGFIVGNVLAFLTFAAQGDLDFAERSPGQHLGHFFGVFFSTMMGGMLADQQQANARNEKKWRIDQEKAERWRLEKSIEEKCDLLRDWNVNCDEFESDEKRVNLLQACDEELNELVRQQKEFRHYLNDCLESKLAGRPADYYRWMEKKLGRNPYRSLGYTETLFVQNVNFRGYVIKSIVETCRVNNDKIDDLVDTGVHSRELLDCKMVEAKFKTSDFKNYSNKGLRKQLKTVKSNWEKVQDCVRRN